MSTNPPSAVLCGDTPIRQTPPPAPYSGSGRWFGPEEEKAVIDVLRRGALTRWGGAAVDALEEDWAARLGVRHAVAVSSGTAAIQVALAALDLPPGAEVITSPVTDMGTVIGILGAGAVPVFADVDPETGMITAETVERVRTLSTKVILPVHLFGRCAPMASLRALADAHGLFLVEDASQAHFSQGAYGLAGVGGHLGCFSLQQSKVVSCGEGGIVVTDDSALHERAFLYQNKGWRRGATGDRAYPFIGANLRMPELSAAVALAQLSKAEAIISRRRETVAVVAEALADLGDVRVLTDRPGERSSWWALAVQWQALATDRDLTLARAVERVLHAEGVPFSLGYIGVRPLSDTAALRTWYDRSPHRRPGPLPGAEEFLRSTFSLIWSEAITPADARDVAAAVRRALPAARRHLAQSQSGGPS